MEPDNNTPQAPDLSDVEMKLPENLQHVPATEDARSPLSGAVIAILILVLLAVLGGLYLWFTQLMPPTNPTPVLVPAVERPTPEANNEPESTTAKAAVETQQALSTSDELIAIEADLLSTDLESLESELDAIDAELEAALDEL